MYIDEPHQRSAPNLESLTLSHIDISGLEQELLDILKERRDYNLGLRKLVVQSCQVGKIEIESKFRELVKEVKWDNVTSLDTSSETDSDLCDDVDICEDYHEYPLSG